MSDSNALGFIGLGVMGEPMCRNLARQSGQRVLAFDVEAAPLQRLAAHGVQSSSLPDLMAACDFVFLSLPSGEVVHQVCHQDLGLLSQARPGQTVIDLSTSAVDTTRALASAFAEKGVDFVDAPVARTRAAAENGTLSIMVGATTTVFERIRPWLSLMGSDLVLCGPVGCGQAVKILNNMVLFETVMALSEAKAIATQAGVAPQVLFEAFANGSADSFALRNHGMKSMLPGLFPEKAFSVRYARKDLNYALKLAQASGVQAKAAELVDAWFTAAEQAGKGDQYHTVISQLIAEPSGPNSLR